MKKSLNKKSSRRQIQTRMFEYFLVHCTVSVLLGIFLSSFYGRMTTWISSITLFLGALVPFLWIKNNTSEKDSEEYYLWKSFREKKIEKTTAFHSIENSETTKEPELLLISTFSNSKLWTRIFLIVLGFIIFRHMTYLFYYAGGWWKTLHPNNYGDLPLHLTFIRFISQGQNFPPLNPFFSADKLRYPLGMDFYNALWESVGVPTTSHLFLTGIICFIAILWMLYQWAGVWGWAAIFLNAGWVAWDGTILSTAGGSGDIVWKNLFLSVLLTQRGFLFALPLGLWLLKEAISVLYSKTEWHRKDQLFFGWLWGCLAIFHLHGFVAISAIMVVWFTVQKKWKKVLPAFALAVSLSTPVVLYSTHFIQKASSVVQWRWGWGKSESESFFYYLWKNFGPWLLVILALAWETSFGSLKKFKMFFWVSVGFLFSVQIISLAPWDWDNIKLVIWYYISLIPILAIWIEQRWTHWASKAVLALVLFLPGYVSLVQSVSGDWKGMDLYRQSELNLTREILERIPINSVVLTMDTFQHPISFWGRGIVLGYVGHLWSHGINSSEVQKSVDEIFRGEQGWIEKTRKLGVTHIYWGAREREKYQMVAGVEQGWKKWKNISNRPEMSIYEAPETLH